MTDIEQTKAVVKRNPQGAHFFFYQRWVDRNNPQRLAKHFPDYRDDWRGLFSMLWVSELLDTAQQVGHKMRFRL